MMMYAGGEVGESGRMWQKKSAFSYEEMNMATLKQKVAKNKTKAISKQIKFRWANLAAFNLLLMLRLPLLSVHLQR